MKTAPKKKLRYHVPTSITIDPRLKTEAVEFAEREGYTLSSLVAELLRKELEKARIAEQVAAQVAALSAAAKNHATPQSKGRTGPG